MKTTGFLVLAIALGARLTPTWFRQAARLRSHGALLAVGLCFCFFVSWAASAVGLAALVGAFAAGLVLEDVPFRAVRAARRTVARRTPPADDCLPRPGLLRAGRLPHEPANDGQPGLADVPFALTIAAVIGKLCVRGRRDGSTGATA